MNKLRFLAIFLLVSAFFILGASAQAAGTVTVQLNARDSLGESGNIPNAQATAVPTPTPTPLPGTQPTTPPPRTLPTTGGDPMSQVLTAFGLGLLFLSAGVGVWRFARER